MDGIPGRSGGGVHGVQAEVCGHGEKAVLDAVLDGGSDFRHAIQRAAERLVPERGLVHAGNVGRSGGASEQQDIAARMRAAWEAHQGRSDGVSGRGHASEPASSLAERMRDAAQGIDRKALAERAAELQRDRLAEDRQRVEEAERLQQRERLRELEQEVRHRDRGMDHGL